MFLDSFPATRFCPNQTLHSDLARSYLPLCDLLWVQKPTKSKGEGTLHLACFITTVSNSHSQESVHFFLKTFSDGVATLPLFNPSCCCTALSSQRFSSNWSEDLLLQPQSLTSQPGHQEQTIPFQTIAFCGFKDFHVFHVFSFLIIIIPLPSVFSYWSHLPDLLSFSELPSALSLLSWSVVYKTGWRHF